MSEQETASRILLVEDDIALASMVADFLRKEGMQVEIESRGDRATERVLAEKPDAIILDVGLPGLDGFSVCRQIRDSFEGPILILTARGDEVDEVVGLEVGADDYMAKPVRPRALLARLRGHLRRGPHAPTDGSPAKIQLADLVVDASQRKAELHGKPIDLTTGEFELLWLLAQNAGQVLSRDAIYQQLHGMKLEPLDRSVDLRVSRLRKKLGDESDSPQWIISVRGVGYMLAVPS